MQTKPELLAPAGSPEALDAAIAAGADAVYFGTAAFNARMNAKNFDGDTLIEAFKKCRSHGVKTNITLNTLIHDREMDELLRHAELLYKLGADALIVADLGAARLIHRYFPDFELHASTQVAGHNTLAAKELQKLGFSRMVAARELSFENLSTVCRESPIETELFIHGAICVSQSGQCLASSLIGGRSGNRGECAQPCRLPYKCEGCSKKESYALSLKDMCLAEHIPELLKLGAASFKIEGRMKAPEYVYGVTSIYRRLLDEGRNATFDELNKLRSLFSRSGFTDGYFVNKLGREMLGIRTSSDKAESAANTKTSVDYAKLCENRRREQLKAVDISAVFKLGEPSKLTLRCGEYEVSALGQASEAAKNCPLTIDSTAKNLTKFGGTCFKPAKLSVDIDERGVMLPISALNALRRDAISKLNELIEHESEKVRTNRLPDKLEKPSGMRTKQPCTARFTFLEQIPEKHDFNIVYLPLERVVSDMQSQINIDPNTMGVIIPPVIFDSELGDIRNMLADAKEKGISHALVSNIGHIELAREVGMTIHGDFRLNVYNSYTVDSLLEIGFSDVIASPELTLPQLRDLGLPAVIYGRIPLMTLEKCVIRDLYSCKICSERHFLPLIDRRGVKFPLMRCFDHRNILYNSVPIYMADRQNELARAGISNVENCHFIFSDESPDDVKAIINAHRNGLTTDMNIRRISK
ncbi:MAG: U32 family peptidase [Clostridiales bacterium]|nr:U32 family peptidase [Clostridiales bacterium]